LLLAFLVDLGPALLELLCELHEHLGRLVLEHGAVEEPQDLLLVLRHQLLLLEGGVLGVRVHASLETVVL
jgi:hypothetical protein